MESIDLACRECEHYFVGDVDPSTMKSQTICRRYPPVPLAIPTPQGIMMMAVFPSVAAENSCGDFEPKEEQH